MGMQPLFLLGLGGHSKEASDEGDLPTAVSFAHPSDLSLANHVHDLIPLERSPCRFNRKKAHPWFDQPFDEAMVLLDQGIQVFDLPQFDRCWKRSAGFELCNGLGIGRIFIDSDHTRSRPGGVGVRRSRRQNPLFLDRMRLRS
jgi:hypothetical protein